MRDLLLLAHVVVGALALLAGPTVLLVPAWLRAAAFLAYSALVTAVTLTAVGLVAVSPGLWWLLPVAAATQGSLLLGARARRRRWRHWPAWQAHLLGGSYVALVTGLAVGSTGAVVAWVLPALLAQAPIAVTKRRLNAQRAALVVA